LPNTNSMSAGFGRKDPFGRILNVLLIVTGMIGIPALTASVNAPRFERLKFPVACAGPLCKENDGGSVSHSFSSFVKTLYRIPRLATVDHDIMAKLECPPQIGIRVSSFFSTNRISSGIPTTTAGISTHSHGWKCRYNVSRDRSSPHRWSSP